MEEVDYGREGKGIEGKGIERKGTGKKRSMPSRFFEDRIRCSFCNKTENQVNKMVSAPNGLYICDLCVDICAEIIEKELEEENAARELRQRSQATRWKST